MSMYFIRIAAWIPPPSGRGGNAASPPRKCRRYSLVCSHVPVPSAPHARPGSGAAGPLRPRPVHLEPRGRAAPALAPGPGKGAGLPGAVPAAHRRPRGASVAGRRFPDGAAAGAARLRPGDGRLLRPAEPGGQAIVAQGRPGRGIPGRRGQARRGAPPVPPRRRGARAEGRVGAMPPGIKSYRVTLDRAGRWHVAFTAIPEPVPAPGNGQVVGVDRGVAAGAALSTGELLHVPGLTAPERKRLPRLERKLARARRGSYRRARVKLALARLKARETDRRKDRAEKTSTDLARRFDIIRVENLDVKSMTRSARGTADAPGRNVRAKAGLNRGILRSGWGLLVRRLEEKAPGRVEKVKPHFTSQRCSACGHVDPESRERQARFVCRACGVAAHADVNAARNIAAGHAVTARGGDGAARPVNREPHLLLQSA